MCTYVDGDSRFNPAQAEPEENLFIERLNACPPGVEHWKNYQTIIREILARAEAARGGHLENRL